MDVLHEQLVNLAKDIWAHPEIRFKEFYSSQAQQDLLGQAGFKITNGLAGIPTAFKAEWGCGSVSVGFLGEFDALAGLSQKADVFEPAPLKEDGLGHGCGHNLLGVASIGAAIQVKEYIEKTGANARVTYFGCPGEEGGSGKAFMAKAGVFDDLDFALTWHPGTFNGVMACSLLANRQVYVRFQGTAAHAAAAPQLGRSALDGLEMLNIGIQFLREHMDSSARIHYAITDTGGDSPNVVQSHAEGLYLIRATTTERVNALYARFEKIVQGAALMTETKADIIFDKACSNVTQNWILERILYDAFQEVGVEPYSEEDIAYAKKYRSNYPQAFFAGDQLNSIARDHETAQRLMKTQIVHEGILSYEEKDRVMMGSSDVGDVSNVVPTAQIVTSTWPFGTPAHSWQAVAMGCSPLAMRGMFRAMKVLTLAAEKLIQQPDQIRRAKEELESRRGPEFVSPIPDGAQPNLS